MINYELSNGKILKSGKELSINEILKDLQRKSYLETKLKELSNTKPCFNCDKMINISHAGFKTRKIKSINRYFCNENCLNAGLKNRK